MVSVVWQEFVRFGEAVKTGFCKYIAFDGRASRIEFWYFSLFALGGGAALWLMYQPLIILFAICVYPAYFAVTVRRLHDVGRTGWWLLLPLVSLPVFLVSMMAGLNVTTALSVMITNAAFVIVGAALLVLIVWYCRQGDPATNRFGPPPV